LRLKIPTPQGCRGPGRSPAGYALFFYSFKTARWFHHPAVSSVWFSRQRGGSTTPPLVLHVFRDGEAGQSPRHRLWLTLETARWFHHLTVVDSRVERWQGGTTTPPSFMVLLAPSNHSRLRPDEYDGKEGHGKQGVRGVPFFIMLY
jgi:hypothetical protein